MKKKWGWLQGYHLEKEDWLFPHHIYARGILVLKDKIESKWTNQLHKRPRSFCEYIFSTNLAHPLSTKAAFDENTVGTLQLTTSWPEKMSPIANTFHANKRLFPPSPKEAIPLTYNEAWILSFNCFKMFLCWSLKSLW